MSSDPADPLAATFADLAALWSLDPAVTHLNHGSFGACPTQVLAAQAALREAMERNPVAFFDRQYVDRLAGARRDLGSFVGCHPDDLAFVPNATAGVNTVLRSLDLQRGEELLTTDHEYAASRNALDFVAGRSGARVVVAPIPFPLAGGADPLQPIMERVGPRTRLVLVDHVTSPTGMVLPVELLAEELRRRQVDLLVDGAHAPGMIQLQLEAIGATYYTANCHKWLCAPKGAAFLWVHPDRQASVRPLAISHGAGRCLAEAETRFRAEHDWTGTHDPSAILCVPEAIRYLGSLLPGGWSAIRERNRSLALAARQLLCDGLGIPEPCDEARIGSLAAIPLPDGDADALKSALHTRHGIEAPVYYWPGSPKRVLRISAQLYNQLEQYQRLLEALKVELARTKPANEPASA